MFTKTYLVAFEASLHKGGSIRSSCMVELGLFTSPIKALAAANLHPSIIDSLAGWIEPEEIKGIYVSNINKL